MGVEVRTRSTLKRQTKKLKSDQKSKVGLGQLKSETHDESEPWTLWPSDPIRDVGERLGPNQMESYLLGQKEEMAHKDGK